MLLFVFVNNVVKTFFELVAIVVKLLTTNKLFLVQNEKEVTKYIIRTVHVHGGWSNLSFLSKISVREQTRGAVESNSINFAILNQYYKA